MSDKCTKCGAFVKVTRPPVVLIHPAVAEIAGNVEKLADAGYVVVVANPDSVQELTMAPHASSDTVFQSALEAIRDAGSSSVRTDFGYLVSRRLLEAP